MPIRPLQELDVRGKRVLLRADFNVPLIDEAGTISLRDDQRIQAALPTLRWLLDQGASQVIAMSHLGNPKSEDPKQSLRPVGQRLEQLLGESVTFISDWVGSEGQKLVKNAPSRVFLLENLRFHRGEKELSQEPDFVDQLAALGDCYVFDAFGTAHREDSSCVALTKAFKGRAASGFLLSKEVEFLSTHLENPARPFIAIVGGAKISTKLGVLDRLLERCDGIAIVGAMTYTFLLAKGIQVGKSLHEPEFVPRALEILNKAKELHKKIYLPSDVLVASSLEETSVARLVPTDRNLPADFEGVDIGTQSIEELRTFIEGAQTLFWNGPAGIFEQQRFAKGTQALAQMLATHPATTIVGGGDSAAAVNNLGLADRFDHVSTGGGASLELIEKGDLPALKALRESF